MCNCDLLQTGMVSATYVSPMPHVEVAHTCLHGINPCHKAVLRGKKIKKRNPRDEKRNWIKPNDIIISKKEII